jgi:hypothetical protein
MDVPPACHAALACYGQTDCVTKTGTSMSTPVHDFYRPIPPSTVRVSVILGGDSYTVDLPSDRLGDTLTAFEYQNAPLTADRCMAVAVAAARDDDAHVVTSAALWLFLFQPGDECVMNTGRLGEMIASNGSALLTAVVCARSSAWTFRLFAMPRWPAAVASHRATKRDLRRRWR